MPLLVALISGGIIFCFFVQPENLGEFEMLENQFIDIVEFEATIHDYLERYKKYRGTSAPLMCLVFSFTKQ